MFYTLHSYTLKEIIIIMATINRFGDLDIWKKSRLMSKNIFLVTRKT